MCGVSRTCVSATRDDPSEIRNVPLALSHSRTLALSHSRTLALSHSRTLALSHSRTLALSHSRTLALSHSRTLALSHSRTLALSHSRTLALSHSRTLALSHSRTLALSHFRTSALPHFRTHALSSVRRHRGLGVVVAQDVLLADGGAAGTLVVVHAQHLVQALADPLDMGDEDHLLEAVFQVVQQLDDVVAARHVQRAEHLVQDEQRQRVAGALGDHLRQR